MLNAYMILLAVFISCGLAKVAPRQESNMTRNVGSLPTGLRDTGGDLESGLPFPCIVGCQAPASAYFVCFITGTTGPISNQTIDQDACATYLCDQNTYDQLRACLNCIISNGEERPYGYHTNSALTTQSLSPIMQGSGITTNPNGLLDREQADGWLRNVTERCSQNGRSLTGETTITATATTTGPYYTTWTPSATVDISLWTGLAQYTEASLIDLTSAPDSTTRTSGTGGSSGGSVQATSAAASAATSAPLSGGVSKIRVQQVALGLTFVVAWALI